MENPDQDAPVVILGGGFAGLSCFRAMDRRRHPVRLIADRNHFLFTPLLTMAATGSVEPRSIIEPLRSFQRAEEEVLIGKAEAILPGQRLVRVSFAEGEPQEVKYRGLVLATGAETATYGIPGVEEHCLFFKEIRDAGRLREKALFQFERATRLKGKERSRALRFVVVGAGATGVELACDLHDLIHEDLKRHFKDLARDAEILIIEATEEILAPFDRQLKQYAAHKLSKKNIQIRTDAPVKKMEKNRALLPDDQAVEAETVIWAAGIGPNALIQQTAEKLGVELKGGRLPVDERLHVNGAPEEIHAVGDCSVMLDVNDNPLPATAQVAMKQGQYLARRLCGKTNRPFRFQSMGMLASLGSGAAIADLPKAKFKGVLAWWFWKAAYLTRLVGWRNKSTVAFDWLKLRAFGRNTSRMAPEHEGRNRPAPDKAGS